MDSTVIRFVVKPSWQAALSGRKAKIVQSDQKQVNCFLGKFWKQGREKNSHWFIRLNICSLMHDLPFLESLLQKREWAQMGFPRLYVSVFSSLHIMNQIDIQRGI